jgi:carboxymethylenebutenolidase
MPRTAGLEISQVDVATPDGTCDCYLARPQGDAPRAGVLFLADAFGLRPRIEAMAARIAGWGYLVLAPNPFYRAGRAPVLAMPDITNPQEREAFMKEAGPLMAELTPERLAADGAAYLDFLAAEAPGPVAITGYCLGGRNALRIATAHPDRVRAVGSFHGGGIVTDADDSPHRSLERLHGELYFAHADHDPSMTAAHIATLEDALTQAGVDYRSELYGGSAHGFTMSDTAMYDERATERHFVALRSLLERALSANAESASPAASQPLDDE